MDPIQEFDEYIAKMEHEVEAAKSRRESMKPLTNPPPPPPRVAASSSASSSSVPSVKSEHIHHQQYGLYNSFVNPIRTSVADPSIDYSPRRALDAEVRNKLPPTKLPPPSKYDGSMNRAGHNRLRSFITEVNRYLRLYQVDEHSPNSLAISSMLLTDVASEWLDQIESSTNPSITKPTC